MGDTDLARDYVRRAEARLQTLLALKGLLRYQGVAPGDARDVSHRLLKARKRLPSTLHGEIVGMAEISRWLSALAVKGPVDPTTTAYHSAADARRASRDAHRVVQLVRSCVREEGRSSARS